MAHRMLERFPKLKNLVFVRFAELQMPILRLTGNPLLAPGTAMKIMCRFYACEATDADFILLDESGAPCEDVDRAAELRMRTGIRGIGGRSVWLTAVPCDEGDVSRFRTVEMLLDGDGHRLIRKYPAMRGFVFLYTKFLLENLRENANACLDGVSDWKTAVRIMNRTYRELDDSEISITCAGHPCEESEADEICFPTGFYTADEPRRRVMIHCERGDSGKDHPWCLRFFAPEEIAETEQEQTSPDDAIETKPESQEMQQAERPRGLLERLRRWIAGQR